jgi:hypothetical protein
MRRPSQWMRDLHVMPFWNAEMASLSVAQGSSMQRLEKHSMYSRRLPPPPRRLLAIAQLPLFAGAHVGALEVPDEDPM